MSRETIREILRDCFQFLSFDENPRLLFDPDNQFEFSPRGPIPEPNRREDPSVEPEPAPDDPPIPSEAPQMEDRIKLSSTVAAIHTELTCSESERWTCSARCAGGSNNWSGTQGLASDRNPEKG